MNENQISIIITISLFTLIFIVAIVFTIVKKIKDKNKPESKLKQPKIITVTDADRKDHTLHIFQNDYPFYGIILLVLLGLMWVGIYVDFIYLICIGGFYDDSWVIYILISEAYLLAFNILPIIYWGYRNFAKNFARGATLGVLTLTLVSSLRGSGISDPPINYGLLPARALLMLLAGFLPWVYILMWYGETLSEKQNIERAKKSALIDYDQLPRAYKLPEELSLKLRELKEKGNEEEYDILLESIIEKIKETNNIINDNQNTIND